MFKNILKNSGMDIDAATKRIDSLIAGLVSLKTELLGTEPLVPAQTIERKEQNRCVACGKSLRGEATPWRGCHSKCAQAVNRRIKAGKLTDREAIEQGKWGPSDVSGRPSIDSPVKRKPLPQIEGMRTVSEEELAASAQDDADMQQVHNETKAAQQKAAPKKNTAKKKTG